MPKKRNAPRIEVDPQQVPGIHRAASEILASSLANQMPQSITDKLRSRLPEIQQQGLKEADAWTRKWNQQVSREQKDADRYRR